MWVFSFCMMQTQHVINCESENRTGNTCMNGLNDIHLKWSIIKAIMATKELKVKNFPVRGYM